MASVASVPPPPIPTTPPTTPSLLRRGPPPPLVSPGRLALEYKDGLLHERPCKHPSNHGNLRAISPVRCCGTPHRRQRSHGMQDWARNRGSRFPNLSSNLSSPWVEPPVCPLAEAGVEVAMDELRVAPSGRSSRMRPSGARLSEKLDCAGDEEGGEIEDFFQQLCGCPFPVT
jgi:hypothetical protein